MQKLQQELVAKVFAGNACVNLLCARAIELASFRYLNSFSLSEAQAIKQTAEKFCVNLEDKKSLDFYSETLDLINQKRPNAFRLKLNIFIQEFCNYKQFY